MPNSIDTKKLLEVAKLTFDTDKPTAEQLKYVMTMYIPSMYLLAHHSVHGHPITFSIPNRDSSKAQSHRPWQIDIINDQSRDKVVIKSRQLGLSEMHAAESLWFADSHSEDAVKVLYTFPTNRQLDTFVKTRFDPLFAKGYYGTIVDPRKSSMKEKQIRDSFLVFRSSSKSSAVEGVDIDALYLDEYDRVQSQAEDSAVESMASSRFKLLRRFSTPTTPDYGIDRLFKKSDMKYYMHTCTHCGYVNKMKYADFNENDLSISGNIRLINPDGINQETNEIEDNTYDFVCQRCGKHLDRWYTGHWQALHPERKDISGYMISQMNAVWVSATDLKRKEQASRSLQTFHNYVLGEPYQDLSMSVFDSDVWDNLSNDYDEPIYDRDQYEQVAVGIDWGTKENHIVVMGISPSKEVDVLRLIRVPVTNSTSSINHDINQTIVEIAPYNPDIILADLGFNGTKVLRLIKEFGKDKVYGVKVNPSKTTGEVNPTFSDTKNEVTIDKLANNMFFINQMKSGSVKFWNNENDPELQTYLNHWKNVIIRDEEDEDGDLTKVISRKGADHYAQSSVYALIGLRKLIDVGQGNGSFDYTNIEIGNTFQSENLYDIGY